MTLPFRLSRCAPMVVVVAAAFLLIGCETPAKEDKTSSKAPIKTTSGGTAQPASSNNETPAPKGPSGAPEATATATPPKGATLVANPVIDSMDDAKLIASAVKPEPPLSAPSEIVTPEGEVLFVRQTRDDTKPGGVVTHQYCEKQLPDGTFTKHGPWARWFPDGNPYLSGEFLDGREHGMVYSWFPNGQLRGVGQFEFGEKTGKWIRWDDVGRKRMEWYYRNNLRNGPYTEWDEQGEISKAGEYVDERENGVWVEVVNGERRQRTWKNGVPQD